MPIVDLESINLTATVLVARPASPVPGLAEAEAGATDEPAPADGPSGLTALLCRRACRRRLDRGVDVFAFCNNPVYGIGAPSNLTDGSTIEIFWAWFASTDAYLRQHIANATHELRINGTQIANVDQFRSAPRQRGRDQVVYWYVPYGPLEAGNYRITYRVTWRNAINDGYQGLRPGHRHRVRRGKLQLCREVDLLRRSGGWLTSQAGAGEVLLRGGEVHLSIPLATSERYHDAQISDYHAAEPRFFNRPPLRLSLLARGEGNINGTAGFGFWNQVFVPGRRRFRLPQAIWFFFGSAAQ